jgi:hypothetical protein
MWGGRAGERQWELTRTSRTAPISTWSHRMHTAGVELRERETSPVLLPVP